MRRLTLLGALAGVVGGVLPFGSGAQPPDLAVLTLQAPAAFTNGPNPVISIQWGVTNQGGPMPWESAWVDSFYLSTNGVLDDTATALMGGLWMTAGQLDTGSYSATQLLALPITNSGVWYLHGKTDNGNQIAESNEGNNVGTVSLTATILAPDLKPLGLVTPPSYTGPPLPNVTIAWGVTNQGPGPANGSAYPWGDALFLSTNTYRDGTEQSLGWFVFTNNIVSGDSYWVTNRVRLPLIQSGSYYLILQTAPDNRLLESDTNNNTLVVPLEFHATPPDLAPVLFQVATEFTGTPNPTLTLIWGVTNQGAGPAIGQIGTVYGWSDGWLDQFYVSTNAVLDATAKGSGYWQETNALAAGASYFRTNTFTLPVVASGTYYLFLVTDAYNGLAESDFSNNVASRAITLTIQPPDLAPLPLDAPSVVIGQPGTLVSIVAGVTNQGVGSAIPFAWSDRLELWTGPDFPGPGGYRFVAQWQRTNALLAGDCYWVTNDFPFPEGGGQFSLVFKTDAWDNLYEANETNNVVSARISFMIPPRLEGACLGADGAFWANAVATLGFNYTLQASSNLVNWVELSTFNYTSWPMPVSEPGAAGRPQRFYRLVAAPAVPP